MMPRIPKALRPKQDPPREPAPGRSLIYSAFCPCCGMTRGIRRGRDRKGEDGLRSAWGLLPGSRQHLGMIQRSGGRGVIETVGYFEPGEDPYDLFQQVKEQLVQGAQVWYAKGWLTDDDLERMKEGARE